MIRLLSSALLLLVFVQCNTPPPLPPPFCTPGKTEPCPCTNDAMGIKTCQSDGKEWAPCVCPQEEPIAPLPPAVLFAPEDKAKTPSTPVFGWTSVKGALGYIVVVQHEPVGSRIWESPFIPGGVPTTSTVYKGQDVLVPSNYYWFVYAYTKKPKDITRFSSQSEVWEFRVDQ